MKECGVSAQFPVIAVYARVSTAPFPACGGVRCAKPKFQETRALLFHRPINFVVVNEIALGGAT